MLKEIEYQLEKVLDSIPPPITAAFDADGTLWPGDVGRSFFHYQVKKDLLKEKNHGPSSRV